MIKNLLRILGIPFVYVFHVFQFFFKWFITFPVMIILHLLKRTILIIIIGVAAGFFLTPLATVIIVALGILIFIVSAIKDAYNGKIQEWHINWNHGTDVMSKNRSDRMIRKHKKYVALANKKYHEAAYEFAGFDAISKIYVKR